MSELTPLPHPSEIDRIEFEDDMTDAERVAVVCLYVLEHMIPDLDDETRESLKADILDIARCDSLAEALENMPMLEDYVEGNLDSLFDAIVKAGLAEDIQPAGDAVVLLGRVMLGLPPAEEGSPAAV
jgi:hypothetical protein